MPGVPGLLSRIVQARVRPDRTRRVENRPVLLTAVGGGLRHSLVVEHQLRPLFGFFEACTVSTAIYASATEIRAGPAARANDAARLANAVDQFASFCRPVARKRRMTRRRNQGPAFRFNRRLRPCLTPLRNPAPISPAFPLRHTHQWRQDRRPHRSAAARAGVSAWHRHVHRFRDGARSGRSTTQSDPVHVGFGDSGDSDDDRYRRGSRPSLHGSVRRLGLSRFRPRRLLARRMARRGVRDPSAAAGAPAGAGRARRSRGRSAPAPGCSISRRRTCRPISRMIRPRHSATFPKRPIRRSTPGSDARSRALPS